VATTIMKNSDAALDTMVREQLGLDPGQLGSPWSAAISSLLAFAFGAVLVVLPFAFDSGLTALFVAIASAGTALFVVGATMGLLNGRSAWRCGVRQLLLGGGAAVLVFIIGHQHVTRVDRHRARCVTDARVKPPRAARIH